MPQNMYHQSGPIFSTFVIKVIKLTIPHQINLSLELYSLQELDYKNSYLFIHNNCFYFNNCNVIINFCKDMMTECENPNPHDYSINDPKVTQMKWQKITLGSAKWGTL